MSALPSSMTAIEIQSPGGPEVLRPVTVAVPLPGPEEILVKVAVAGVNRPDVLQRAGAYPPPKGASPLPGLEVAGTIAAVGTGVSAWAVGDPVCALTPGGGYAEYCVTPAAQALPLPKGYDMVRGAALPETYFTVWTNLFQRARLKAGETVLIHGGSSGIGTTAIQLAEAFGAIVLATAGSAEKCAACEKLGADRAINYRQEDYLAVAKEVTQGRGVDVVLDMVGGPYVQRNLAALALDGRHVSIAFLGGAEMTLDLRPLMVKRLTMTGSTLRPLPLADKARIARALKDQVWPLLEAGTVAPVIHATFPLIQASDAHRLMEASNHIGKIMLEVD